MPHLRTLGELASADPCGVGVTRLDGIRHNCSWHAAGGVDTDVAHVAGNWLALTSKVPGLEQMELFVQHYRLSFDEPGGRQELKLFRQEDALEWTLFTLIFIFLVIFDNVVLHRRNEVLSFAKACLYTCFWIMVAAAFNLYIYFTEGREAAFTWCTGYLLEWMLSLDNLFVFHLVFKIYGTPDHLKHKPLFYGIVGAIIFRLIFFVVEEALFHSTWWMHIVFGVFLVYTGIKQAAADDEDDDPSKNVLVLWLANHIPIVNGYDVDGRFFIRAQECDDSPSGLWPAVQPRSSPRFQHDASGKKVWKATLLFVVVVCLEVTDIIFAVDSVSAIVAQIPDLYLAYTACVFAMLGLRSMFFVIDELVRMFTLLKYGVAAILVFIGVKLMVQKQWHVSTGTVLAILVLTVVTCCVSSLLLDRWRSNTTAAVGGEAGDVGGTGSATPPPQTSPCTTAPKSSERGLGA